MSASFAAAAAQRDADAMLGAFGPSISGAASDLAQSTARQFAGPESAIDVAVQGYHKQLRTPMTLPRLREIFLNREQAGACKSYAESVARGHSILEVHALATSSEVEALKSEALALVEATDGEAQPWSADLTSDALTFEQRIVAQRTAYLKAGLRWRTSTVLPSGSAAGRHRMPIDKSLTAEGQALCDELLVRALSLLDARLKNALFDGCFAQGPLTCVRNPRLAFSTGEPAINVYHAGGGFKAHEDKQALTVLVPLSAGADFEGAGTAFWSIEHAGPSRCTQTTASHHKQHLHTPSIHTICAHHRYTHGGKQQPRRDASLSMPYPCHVAHRYITSRPLITLKGTRGRRPPDDGSPATRGFGTHLWWPGRPLTLTLTLALTLALTLTLTLMPMPALTLSLSPALMLMPMLLLAARSPTLACQCSLVDAVSLLL